jgi:ABC-type sugar transport system ATPase subunit
MSMPLLSATGVWKAFRGRAVLPGASVVLGRKEALAVVGENGSGKTTLLRAPAAPGSGGEPRP